MAVWSFWMKNYRKLETNGIIFNVPPIINGKCNVWLSEPFDKCSIIPGNKLWNQNNSLLELWNQQVVVENDAGIVIDNIPFLTPEMDMLHFRTTMYNV